jgi:uncharacterized membrane protein YebE (DUF533 family)
LAVLAGCAMERTSMSALSLLEQMLRSGSSALGGSEMSKYATGAVAGGALAMLLGPRRGASRSLLQAGGVAALGAMAWRAYQDHQARQRAAPSQPAGAAPAALRLPEAASFATLPAPAQEAHGRAMLKALIAAAKSDGHVDERERTLIEGELHRLEPDPAMQAWIDAELRRPLDPADVAAAASTPEMGAEIYLASRLATEAPTGMERVYLDALAAALRLDPALRADLDARAAGSA